MVILRFYASLNNSASSLFLSGWLHISRIGSRNVETCTGPAVPLGGNPATGSGTLYFLLAGIGTGIRTGAAGGLVMIA